MQHATVRFGRQGDEVVEEEEIGERVTHGVDVAQIANVTNVIVETSVILLWKQQRELLLNCQINSTADWQRKLNFYFTL